jgi:hypothetical protein
MVDYDAVARILIDADMSDSEFNYAMKAMADVFAKADENFDREDFLMNAGYRR